MLIALAVRIALIASRRAASSCSPPPPTTHDGGAIGGNDPLAHEKSCFLEETRALRETLAQESRALAEARALHALDEQLAAILANDAISLAAKKRAIFELWADCSLHNGGTARHRIESFVQRLMPRGSTLAFSDEELAELNALIDAGERFAPYG